MVRIVMYRTQQTGEATYETQVATCDVQLPHVEKLHLDGWSLVGMEWDHRTPVAQASGGSDAD